MTDTTELIRRAAEYVEWKPIGNDWLHPTRPWRLQPSEERYDLGALVTLVEDKVREKFGPPCIEIMPSYTKVSVPVGDAMVFYTFEHEDQLIALLGALMQVAEKLASE